MILRGLGLVLRRALFGRAERMVASIFVFNVNLLINNPPPFKGLNIRIPMIIPSKGMGFTNVRGLHYASCFEAQACRSPGRFPSRTVATREASELQAAFGYFPKLGTNFGTPNYKVP